MARNLFDRSYGALFLPLDHEQYAPPLYLVWTKLLADLLGYREWVLRLPAFCGGLLAVYATWRGSERLLTGYWRLLPLALLFSNPTVLRFVTEVKPYGLDLGVAALLIGLHLRPRPLPLPVWVGLGILVPWLSLPAVFVLATIGLRGLMEDRCWLVPIAAWLLSFGVLYLLVLRPSVGSGYLNDFHRDYFFPLSLTAEALARTGRILLRLLRLSYGFTLWAMLWGAGSLVIAALHHRKEGWLLWPLLIVIAASSLRLYSLIDRLMLFALPGIWWFSSLGAQQMGNIARNKGRWPVVVVVVTLIAVGGTTVWRYAWSPVETSDSRRLVTYVPGLNYADASAVPVVDYYYRIHPAAGDRTGRPERLNYERLPEGGFNVLYDVTTDRRTRSKADELADRLREEAPNCLVTVEELYRARVVTVKCPARNSDP